MIARHIKHAARVIDRFWFAPRRRAKLAKAMGADDLITKFSVAQRQHKPTKATAAEIKARNRALLERETGWAKLRGEQHG